MSQEDMTADVIISLKRALDNPVTRYILKYLSKGDAIEKALGVFAGTEHETCVRCKFNSFLLGTAINKGAKALGAKDDTFIAYFKDKTTQRGLANVIRGITEYGVTKPQKLHAPFLVVWNYTKACNLKCKHCYAEAGKLAPDELTTDERKEVVDQLDDAGVTALSFSGGEPLARKDFFEIAEYASKKHFYVSLATNGTLITKEIAKKLHDSGVKYAEVSLDGPPDVHNALRGVDCFEQTVRGIKNCVQTDGIMTCIAMTVMKTNVAYLPYMVDFAREIGVDRFIAFNFIPTGKGKEIIDLDLSAEEREDVLRFLYEKMVEDSGIEVFCTAPEYARVALEAIDKGKGDIISPTHFAGARLEGRGIALAGFIGGCGAGRLYCSIEHNGDIQPCVFMPIKVGNVIKDGFLDVWHSSEVLNQLRDREHLGGSCGSCEYRYVCGGCRARAYCYYGDYLAPDPGCVKNEISSPRVMLKGR
jgi:radical SAM protein with 4Fe4S-binding SPASM domain